MRHYKHPSGEVFAFQTEAERQQWGAPELTEMSEAEILAHQAQPRLGPSVPEQVSRAQGKAQLIIAGLWDQVLAWAAAIEDPVEKALAQVALNDTQYWRRDSPTLNAAADSLGLNEEQKDSLFVSAARVEL